MCHDNDYLPENEGSAPPTLITGDTSCTTAVHVVCDPMPDPVLVVHARPCPHPDLNKNDFWQDFHFRAVYDIYRQTVEDNTAADRDSSTGVMESAPVLSSVQNSVQEKVLQTFPFESDGSFTLHFLQVRVLDNFFFKTGDTTHWRNPFGNPSDGDHVFVQDQTTDSSVGHTRDAGVVCSVGAFTFKFKSP